MKHFLIAFSFFSFCLKSNSQQLEPFQIQGKLNSDTIAGKVFLYYSLNNYWIEDSSRVVNGKFSFKGKIPHPVLCRLAYRDKIKEFFFEPAAIKVASSYEDFENAEIAGSSIQKEFDILNDRIRKINNRWKIVFDTLDAVNKRSNVSFQELKGWVLEPYFSEIRDTYIDFYEKKPQSYITAYFLSINIIEMNQGSLSIESLKNYYNKFSKSIRNSEYGKKINQELINRVIATPGKNAIDFTKTDLNGNSLSLSNFRGKYVLLDFWGSWCVPCRKGNPHLKKLYEKYKAKGFEIIGIAADNDTEKAWQKAIKEDDLPWHHILIDDLDSVYNIRSYPTKILINKEGTIIGRFGTDEKELDEQLNSIFR